MDPGFRLLSLRGDDGAVRPGLLVGDRVHDIGERYPSVRSILDSWDEAQEELTALAATLQAGEPRGIPVEEADLAPPVMYPGALYCAGANYRDHVIEMSGKPPPADNDRPYFFLKSTRGTIVGARDDIRLPARSGQVDWEAEIGLVIGREARDVAEENAMDYVAGFVVLNDLSARDHMKRHDVPFLFDWIGQKCFDTACPMGPWLTPRSAVADVHDLAITLSVNDTVHQDSNSSEMIFRCETQVAYLSRHLTLFPGDIIATGTPAGCGLPNGLFLRSGDVMITRVEGLGELRNTVS